METSAPSHVRKKKETLVKRFTRGKAPGFLKEHAQILDRYFYDGFEQSQAGLEMNLLRNPYAIIALGGYGREEQCICSDIDLLFLFRKKVPREAKVLIQEIIYPLWDLGYDVGYATRSIKECLNLAHRNIDVFTSLLDARFLCGMSTLYFDLTEKIRSITIKGRSKKLIAELVEKNMDRHQRFGDSTYLLEPNLKEGQGGLRDYHTMLWIARIQSQLKTPRDLEYYGYLSHVEYQSLSAALEFIWLVRNHLHMKVGRKLDQLSFLHQETLSKRMGFRSLGKRIAVERFLGKLHGEMEIVKKYNLTILSELGYADGAKPRRRRLSVKKTKIQGLYVSNNRLFFSSPEAVVANPTLLIQIFEESRCLKIPLSSEAKRVIQDFSQLVDKRFRASEENRKIFEQILLKPAIQFNVLNEMLNTGFLSSYIPEMKKIINLVQYDTYHLYPVDRHSLFTVRTIKGFALKPESGSADICVDLYKEIGSKRLLLLWAALLHDIGKGEPEGNHADSGAVIVKRVLKRLGYTTSQIETVSFLIKEHLFLVKTATRRDIHDEETVIHCARRIGDAKRLKMLFLLTVGDSMSTGPKAWNDWNFSLLQDLFLKTLKIIEKGELATPRAVEAVKQKIEDTLLLVESEVEKREIEKHFAMLPPRYQLYEKPEAIFLHKKLYDSLGEQPFAWDIFQDRKSDTRLVAVCAPDRPGLFSQIAGVFTLNGLDILDAQAYTWRNGIALSVFRLKAPADQVFEHEKWDRAHKKLEAVLTGKLELEVAMRKLHKAPPFLQSFPKGRPDRIKVDNNSSSFFTIVEVFTHDYPGLLYNITNVFYRNGCNVHVAIIATKVDQVVDIFYVREIQGEKIEDPDKVASLKKELAAVFPIPDPPD